MNLMTARPSKEDDRSIGQLAMLHGAAVEFLLAAGCSEDLTIGEAATELAKALDDAFERPDDSPQAPAQALDIEADGLGSKNPQ